MNRLIVSFGWLALSAVAVRGETLHVSFDAGLKADKSAGRSEPWASQAVELVPGKFGKAAHIGPNGQLIYAGEQNVLAGRGTVACWVRVPALPGPLDVQRLIFIQSKERGYWNYLASMEWQEGAFRAMAFDFYHGHGLHDPASLPAFKAGQWHHIAMVWDQGQGVKFFLDGKLMGSTWGKQAWWERPTPHAIHLSYPGADYDELRIFSSGLSDQQIADLATRNEGPVVERSEPWAEPARDRLLKSLNAVGLEKLPHLEAMQKSDGPQAIIRQTRVRRILDDRIPSWKVMDGRMNLFWPEWRAPCLGDVDFSGSALVAEFEPDESPTHLILRGLLSGARVFGERDGYSSRQPLIEVPAGLHVLAAEKLTSKITGLRVPRNESMKLQEMIPLEVAGPPRKTPARIVTPLTGPLALGSLGSIGTELNTRTLPTERTVLGQTKERTGNSHIVRALDRVHFLSESVAQVTPLDAIELRLLFTADWREAIWWLRVQDPVNPRRDLMYVPLRISNPTPGQEAVLDIVLDHWDIMLDPGARLLVELMPSKETQIGFGEKNRSELSLWPGEREKVLKEFAHTQSRLAFSYWQLGSEVANGADTNKPGFAMLGNITHNRELKLTMEWVRRHVPDDPLVSKLWKVIYDANATASVKPSRQPPGAPEWATWSRELLERFRKMSHAWADVQGPDGQIGGGWNDDTDFPGVFICLPLLGDRKTQEMFTRIYDGMDKTGYLRNGVSRSPIDALHATDFLSWRAHQMLFNYGEPRHVERALDLARELQRWTKVDDKGHRHFLTSHYSEDGPEWQPASEVDSGGLIRQIGHDSSANHNFLRDSIFCGWYSHNPAVLKFVREVAEADLAHIAGGGKVGAYETYPFFSYYRLFGDAKYLSDPVDRVLRDRWNLPIWRRYVEQLPDPKRLDDQLLKATRARTVNEEQLTTAFLITRDRNYLVQALRQACERLEGGWQFRGGEALGANDHFSVPGLSCLSQIYLGGAMTWLRPASILPPIAVSWEGIDAEVGAIVMEANSQKLRVAAFNFGEKPRKVRLRVWELTPGTYQLEEGTDSNDDGQIDGQRAIRNLNLQRASFVEVELPPQKVHIMEFNQIKTPPRPELLADLAIGDGDVFYDKATDRLKVVVHNIGAAPAKDFAVRFETADGQLLGERTIALLEAPTDLKPKTATVYLPQPTLHATERIIIRVDASNKVDEITKENNVRAWAR